MSQLLVLTYGAFDLIITVPADILAPNGAKPSAGAVLIIKLENEDLIQLNWLIGIMSDEQNILDDHGYAQKCVIVEHMRPLLLAWIKFNPSMDK